MIELSKDTEQRLITSIKCFFAENMNQEMNDLKASLFLKYAVRKIGPHICNKTVVGAQFSMKSMERVRGNHPVMLAVHQGLPLIPTCHEHSLVKWNVYLTRVWLMGCPWLLSVLSSLAVAVALQLLANAEL